MKKFKFKLEAILAERKRVEEKRLQEWLWGQKLLDDIIGERKKLELRLEKALQEGTQLCAVETNTSAEFILLEKFIVGLKQRIEWKKSEIERGGKLVEKKKLEYHNASRKRKVLEKLKEKKLSHFKELLKTKELKELDDLYIMRASLREREHEF